MVTAFVEADQTHLVEFAVAVRGDAASAGSVLRVIRGLPIDLWGPVVVFRCNNARPGGVHTEKWALTSEVGAGNSMVLGTEWAMCTQGRVPGHEVGRGTRLRSNQLIRASGGVSRRIARIRWSTQDPSFATRNS